MNHILSEKALRQILATILAGATGKAETYWSGHLGTLRPVPLTTDPKSNWKLTDSTGSASDTRAILKAVDIVRYEHPYIRWVDVPPG